MPRMDFQNILLSEKSRMHKIVCNMISFYKWPKNLLYDYVYSLKCIYQYAFIIVLS